MMKDKERIKEILGEISKNKNETTINRGDKILVAAMTYDMVAMTLKILAHLKRATADYKIPNRMDDETAETIINTMANLQSMLCQLLDIELDEMKVGVRLANVNRDDLPDDVLKAILEDAGMNSELFMDNIAKS